jgi:hypothetical protein
VQLSHLQLVDGDCVQVILFEAGARSHELAGVHVAPCASGHEVLLLLSAVRLTQTVQVNLQALVSPGATLTRCLTR